jgi:hypothetical protein
MSGALSILLLLLMGNMIVASESIRLIRSLERRILEARDHRLALMGKVMQKDSEIRALNELHFNEFDRTLIDAGAR